MIYRTWAARGKSPRLDVCITVHWSKPTQALADVGIRLCSVALSPRADATQGVLARFIREAAWSELMGGDEAVGLA